MEKEKEKEKNQNVSLFDIIFGVNNSSNDYSPTRKREDKENIYDWDNPNNCSEREYDDDDDYDDFDSF